MAKWEHLIEARERAHLSQAEAAEQVGVGVATYQRWEAGKARPQPQHMRQLSQVFGPFTDEIVVGLSISEPSEHASAMQQAAAIVTAPAPAPSAATDGALSIAEEATSAFEEERDEAQLFIAEHLTTRLWFLAFLDHTTCEEKRHAIRQAIEEFDTMHANDKNYQITRREALCSLATLPMITFGLTLPGTSVPPNQYGEVIARCSASIPACWELGKSDEAGDLMLAFKSASKYLSLLVKIAKDSGQYRQESLDLAARYALIKTVVGWHVVGSTEATQYAKEAVTISKESGDISLLLSAYSKLAWSYFYDHKYHLALKTAQDATGFLEQQSQLPNVQQPPFIARGNTYSTLALMLARNGISPEDALGRATEGDPGDEPLNFIEFTRTTVPVETGLTYCYYGDQSKAMREIEKLVDPVTLASKADWGGRNHMGALRAMALSSLKDKARDMEKTAHIWTATMENAIALRSEWGFNEAISIYELMEVIWPGEKRIKDLRDYIVHW